MTDLLAIEAVRMAALATVLLTALALCLAFAVRGAWFRASMFVVASLGGLAAAGFVGGYENGGIPVPGEEPLWAWQWWLFLICLAAAAGKYLGLGIVRLWRRMCGR